MMLQTLILGAVAAGALALSPRLWWGGTLVANWTVESSWPGAVADTATVKLHISGMTCGGCATTARLALKKLDGVLEATVSIADSLGVVRYDPQKVDPPRIAEHLTGLTGYKVRIVADSAKNPGKP